MLKKQCTKCKTIKDISDFNNQAIQKSGLNPACRCCNKDAYIEYTHTKKGLLARIYSCQKTNSKKRGHTPPTYSKSELREWLYSQKKFHVLYDNWKRLDFQTDYRPSVDRKIDSIGYSLSNIQLCLWKQNKSKSYSNARKGYFKQRYIPLRAVIQFTEDMEEIGDFISMSQASRQTNIRLNSISLACRGKRKSAGGFIWKYKEVK